MEVILRYQADGDSSRPWPIRSGQRQRLHIEMPDPAPSSPAGVWADGPAVEPVVPLWRNYMPGNAQRDQEFMNLLDAYRSSGGLARTHEVIASFKRREGSDTQRLAVWIVAHQIISIDWQAQTWCPWFQFDRASGQPWPAVGNMLRELCSVYDDWEIARWFVEPNTCLDGATPTDCLKSRPADALEAARVCRFVAKG